MIKQHSRRNCHVLVVWRVSKRVAGAVVEVWRYSYYCYLKTTYTVVSGSVSNGGLHVSSVLCAG